LTYIDIKNHNDEDNDSEDKYVICLNCKLTPEEIEANKQKRKAEIEAEVEARKARPRGHRRKLTDEEIVERELKKKRIQIGLKYWNKLERKAMKEKQEQEERKEQERKKKQEEYDSRKSYVTHCMNALNAKFMIGGF